MKKILIIAFACFALNAQAQQTVKVSSKPSAVFSPTAGGYILRQPGPSLNLSLTPQPVTPPSGGIKGVGKFSGGQKFRINGDIFEMGADYDMPIPKTNQKAKVSAVSVLPSNKMAKALLKTIPLIGNAYAVGEILDLLADEWHSQDPADDLPVVNPQNGTVTRTNDGCSCPSGGISCGSVEAPPIPPGYCSLGNFDIYDYGPQAGVTRSVIALGTPVLVEEPVPDHIIDSVSQNLDLQNKQKLMDFYNNTPDTNQPPLELPADLPTTVTGPSDVPISTTTKQSSDGTTTTIETKTQLSYDQSKITVQQTTKTTKTGPNGEPLTEEIETVTGETPAPVPTAEVLSPSSADESSGTTPVQFPSEIDLDICKLNPDILACKKLDPPEEGEIPKEDRDITLQTGPTFGGGACIPNVTVQVFGTTITALNFTEPCRWLSDYLKPLLLLMASISAVFIVLPRES